MSDKIFTVKLKELDTKISKLHNQITLSEAYDDTSLKAEIAALKKSCLQTEERLGKMLRFSKNETATIISEAYTKMLNIAQNTKEKAEKRFLETEASSDEKLLMAEYVLDFAALAADYAVLVSLEAIASQKKC